MQGWQTLAFKNDRARGSTDIKQLSMFIERSVYASGGVYPLFHEAVRWVAARLTCRGQVAWKQAVWGQLFTGLDHDPVQNAIPYHNSYVTFWPTLKWTT